jgi:Leucine-rich repeat (LRR) protein
MSSSSSGLFLINNVCTQSSFYNILDNRASVRSALQPCFDNFAVGTTLECFYIAAEFFPYTCELTIVNPQGDDDFESIAGDHVQGNTDTDVLRIEAFSQHTLNLPSIICDTFTSLEEMTITGSRLEVLTSRSFENCRDLVYLDLEHNNISALINVFSTNTRLEVLNLNDNHIAVFSVITFAHTRLWFINVEHNELLFFNAEWFNTINSTLRALNLNSNRLTFLPGGAFSTLRNLEELEIAANNFDEIPADAFEGLDRLGFLAMYRNNIQTLNPAWFRDLTSLHSLHIEYNSISELPEGVFSTMTMLNDVNLVQNRLTTINSNAFGNAAALTTFNAQFNQINAIDPDLFDSADILYILFLYGNICASTNFINVVGSRELVRNALNTCFENFLRQERGDIVCDYTNAEGYGYYCEMSINNPRGSDDFESVEGEY